MNFVDTNGHASTLKWFFPSNGEKQLTCNKSIAFVQNISSAKVICDSKLCEIKQSETSDFEFDVQLENCETSSVDLVSSLSWQATLEKNNVDFGSTWIKEFVESLDYFIAPIGTISIDFVGHPVRRILVDESGDEHYINTLTIYLSYQQNPNLATADFELILQLNETGLEQLLYFGSDLENQYLIKRKGFIK